MSLMIVEGTFLPFVIQRNDRGGFAGRYPELSSEYVRLFESAEELHDWFYATFHDVCSVEDLELVERWLGLDE